MKSIVTFFALFVLTTTYAAPETPLAHRNTDLPTKPTFARIKPISLFEIDLTWRDKSQNEDGFQIERSTDKVHYQQIAQVLPGTTIYRDKNLFPATRYYYRIRAFNASGSSAYSTGASRTPTPARPLTIVTWGNLAPTSTNALDCVSLSEGYNHVLELKKDGTVTAFGDNSLGQSTPPTNLTDVAAIAAGYEFSLALKRDGTVVGWGNPAPSTPPPGLSNVVAISAGLDFGLALKADGTVVGWGENDNGKTTPPPDLKGVVAIAAGYYHSLALKSDGTIVGWGSPVNDETVPPTNATSSVALAADFSTSFAVEQDGSIAAWGDREFGTIPPPLFTDAFDVSAAADHALALTSDGKVVSWGYSDGRSSYSAPDFGGGAVSVSTRGTERAALSLGPASPSDLSATVLAANRVRLSWRNNATGQKGFLIERDTITVPGNADWAQIAKAGANVTNFTDSTVNNTTLYRYRVRAYNPLGMSPYSADAPVSLTPVTPEVSAFLGTNEIDVNWSDSASLFINFSFGATAPYSGIDGFKIERAPAVYSEPGTFTQIGSVNGQTFHFSDTNVQPNTTYWYRVTAFNVLGDSSPSTPVSVSVVPPLVPINFFADLNVTNNHLTLSWLANNNPPSPMGYKIEQAPNDFGIPGPWTQIADLPASTNTYVYSGLPTNAVTWFRVKAYNWVGDSPYSSPTVAIALPPSMPLIASASMGVDQNVQLVWYEATYAAGFSVERAPDVSGSPGTWNEIAEVAYTNDSQHSFTDTNVVANATYWYRVRAFSVNGFSDYTYPVSVSTAPPTNDIPNNLAAFITDGVTLFWNHNRGQLVGFKIEHALDNNGAPGTWTEIDSLSISNYEDVPPFTDTNAVANATNWYRVRAYNWAGFSDYSTNLSIAVVPPEMPYATFALPYRDTIEFEWYAANTGNSESVEIQRALDVNGIPGTWTTIAVTNGFDSAVFDTGLTANATYWYRVRAANWVGYSPYTDPVSATIAPASTPLGVIPQLGPTNSVFLSWSDNGIDEDGFHVESAPDNGGVPGNWTEIATFYNTNAYTVYFSDTHVTANTTNWYRVRSFNNIGTSDYSIPASIAIIPPATPNFFVGFSYPDHIALSWTADYATFSQGFEVERAPDLSGAPGAWAQITLNEGSDTNVTANTTYWYRMRAYNWVGESPYTSAISVSTTSQ